MQSVRRDLNRAQRDADKARASLKRLGMQMGALATVGVGVVAREFHRISRSANDLDKVSKVVAINVEELQKLRFAAQQAAGVASTTLDMAMQRFSRRVGEAANGTGELMGIVKELGISLRDSDGNIKSQTDLLAEFADRITATSSAQEQLRIAFKLFDSEGARLLPLLNKGSQALRDLMQQAEDTGGVISETAVRDFVRFNDELEVLRMRVSAISNSIAENLIGPMADFAEFLNTEEGTAALRELLEDLGRTATVVGTIIGLRMVGQLTAASVALGVATFKAAQASIALAGMASTATAASGTFRGLGIAIRGMMGPLGILVTAGVLLAPQFMRVKESFDQSQVATESLADEVARLTGNIKDLQRAELERAMSKVETQASETQRKLADVRREIEKIDKANKQASVSGGFLDPAIIDLRDYEQALTATSEELAEMLSKLQTALKKLSEGTTDSFGDANDEIDKFRQKIEDLAAELSGESAVALLQYQRAIRSVFALMDKGLPFEEATQALELFRQKYEQTIKELADKEDGLDLGSILANAISISDGASIGESLGNALRTAGSQGLQQGLQDSLNTALRELKLDDTQMQVAMVAIGEAIGGSIGAAAGTAIGATIGAILTSGSPIGMQIGAQIGNAIGNLLDPQKDPKFQIGGAFGFAGTGGQAQGLFETIFGEQLFRFRGIEDAAADQIKTALVNFDNTIASIITDETQFGMIANALANFGYDSQDEAASVEELLRQRFDAILSTFDSFTQGIVRQAYGLEAQVQRLAELQVIQRQALFVGTMGFATEQEMIAAVADMQRGTESLIDTFNRFVGTMQMLETIGDLTGVQIRDSHDALVAFGNELLQVFGDDMQKFESSLRKIFDTFFEADEVLEQSANATREQARRLLSDLGIFVTDEMLTKSGFRQLFEELSSTLSPQDLAILIEAGATISDMIGFEERLAEARGQAYGVLTALTAEGEAFAQAMIATEEAIATGSLNAFQQEMLNINRQLFRTINAINSAVGSAITQERAERALARAHEAAAIQAQAAVARLEASTIRLVQEVFGTPLTRINDQINALENSSNDLGSSLFNAAQAMADLVAFADSLLVGQLSPLGSRERLDIGLEQLRAASEAGDVQAVQALAQQVLQIGRERFATGPEFAALFQEVQDIIRATEPQEQQVQQVEVVNSPELEDLYRRRDAILREQAAADRRASAFEIAQAIADISAATGRSFEEVAADLGVPLSDLASVLGMDMGGLGSLLETLAVDTFSLAQTLETYATEIRDAILQMTNAILAELRGREFPDTGIVPETPPVILPGPVIGPPPPVAPPEPQPLPAPEPPPIPVGPPAPSPFQPDPTPSPQPDDLIFTSQVAKNTKDTAVAITRLTEAVERGNTRSSRTALA